MNMKIWTGMMIAALTMAVAQAQTLQTGAEAPSFELKDPGGNVVRLSDFAGRTVVLEWTNMDCPFVKKHYKPGNMQKLQATYGEKDVVWLVICSSAPGKQGHYSGAEWMKIIEEKGIAATAVLLDEEGAVGRAYGASNTPHLFIVGADGKLVYQGAIDDKPSTESDDIAKSHNYVAAALDEILAGRPVSQPLTKAYGCSVKY